jgi:NAD(P)-dependent dehydrogenase (short-subunit alcohol dehydrogenase family)
MELDGKVCLVIGASRGIGRAAAEAIAAEGAQVIVASRDQEACGAVAAEIGAHGGAACAQVADVTDPDSLHRLGEFIEQEFGQIDLAFLNAGTLRGAAPIPNIPREQLRITVETNLYGAFFSLQTVLPLMRKDADSSIVLNSAGNGMRGRPLVADYVASKWGVVGLGLSAALEAATDGIRVNVIAPGFIGTDAWMTKLGAQQDSLAARVPLGTIGKPEDVAAVVVWLLSPASRYVTGSVVPIDGGLLAAGG